MDGEKCEKDFFQGPASAVKKEGKVRFSTATFYIFARANGGGENDLPPLKNAKARKYSRPKEKMKTSEKNDLDGLTKTLKEHFIYSARERVAYKEIVETFLPYEKWFKCFSQRDVILAIQSVFKGVIAKPSSKESVVFLNLSKRAESIDLGEVIDTYSVNLESPETVECKIPSMKRDARKPLQVVGESLDCVTSALKTLTVVETSVAKGPGESDFPALHRPTLAVINSRADVQKDVEEDVVPMSSISYSDGDILETGINIEKAVINSQKTPTRCGKKRMSNASGKAQDSAVNPKQCKKIPITSARPHGDCVSQAPAFTFGTNLQNPTKRSSCKQPSSRVVKQRPVTKRH